MPTDDTYREGGRVLNAFRHHRGRHLNVAAFKLGTLLCSTPFGITEVGTRSALPDRCGTIRCSTPFGITEVGTRSPRR